MNALSKAFQTLQMRIQRACNESGRDPNSVELLAVSKHQPVEAIQTASLLGIRRFGENYVQEAAAKARQLPGMEFTLIGPLQRNKVKTALELFQEIQTLDRLDLVQRMARLAEELQVVKPIWIQVDLWKEATKQGGCPPEAIPELIEALGPRLPLKGFMAIPPPGHISAFKEMADLRERYQDLLKMALNLSMGMSDDLEEAIRAGSDQIRIGTALFGFRS